MRGRTNITNGGMNINADVEEFAVADGSNIVAGNFVQFKTEKNDKKYDTNTGYFNEFYKSQNDAPKVLPCGNDKYIRRYRNNGETNQTWFNLVDVSDGFRVISTFSISSTNIPSFCLLDDGNIAICHMEEENSFTIYIYNIENTLELLNTYKLINENIGETGSTHITQLGNSKIIAIKMNDYFICDYSLGEISESSYGNLGLEFVKNTIEYQPKQLADNDWNVYATGEDSFLVFPMFYLDSYRRAYSIFLFKYADKVILLDKIEDYIQGYIWQSLNAALWGNAFGINGKILFSSGGVDYDEKNERPDSYNAKRFYETRIFYVQNGFIMQSQNINLLELAKEAFLDLDIMLTDSPSAYSSGTAQYVKNNVFYVSVLPEKTIKSTGEKCNINSRTAIYRVEYDENSGLFAQSNVETFEGDAAGYYFGYGQFFESESGDAYYLYETHYSGGFTKTGRWISKLTYEDGMLKIGETTKLVENYTGNKLPIGIAKQSGKSGDVIEVYVPKA